MSEIIDPFDSATTASNIIDPFDSGEPINKAPEKSGTIRRALGDTGVSLLKGAIGVPETVVGIADLVTGGHAGKLAESAGFKPKQAKEFISDYYSPEQKLANQKVQEADGFVNTIKAALQNPSTIAQTTAESLPVMGLGGVASRGLLTVAPKVAPLIAGAAGEGLVTAGQNAEQVRQENADGLLTGKQAAIQAGSGLLTGAISGVSGNIAQKLGIADIETMLAQGKLSPAQLATGLPKAIAGGVVTEGLLEEAPQSAQEQIAQNLSLDKPWDEGVGNAAAMGALSGGLMGGGANALNAFGGKDNTQVTPPPAPPAPEGSLTSAATIAQAVGLTQQPVTPDVTAEAKPNIVDSLNAVEAQQSGIISDTTIAPEQPIAEMPAPTIAPEQVAEKQRIDEIANQAATSPLNDLPQPTEAQKEAGNYKKAHLKYDGLNITVENPQGSTRSGVDEDNNQWTNTLANHYGYIKRTKGNDGDNLDVFVGDKPASGKVFVINQTKKDGSFDEHKAVLGAETADEAIAIYKANYADDWNGGKSVTELTTPAFKDWLKNGDPTKPLETVHAASNETDMSKLAVGEQVDVGGVPYVKTENGFERVTNATENVVNATSVDTINTLPERVDETANGVQVPAINQAIVGEDDLPFDSYAQKNVDAANNAKANWISAQTDLISARDIAFTDSDKLYEDIKQNRRGMTFEKATSLIDAAEKDAIVDSVIANKLRNDIAPLATTNNAEPAQPTDTVRPLVEQLTKLRATADKHPSFDPALKAAKDFMAGKKVSPRQFKNFANLLGKKNKAFREVLMQLHDQAASTPEQLAAKEKKSKLAKAMLAERMKLDTTKDGLMQAMAKLGGLNADKAKSEFGIDPADMRQHGAGIKRSFNKNGLDADTMRELLLEQGYPVGDTVADLGNAIADAMSGIDVLTAAGQEALAQKKYEEYANGIDELSDDEQAALDELMTKATAKYGAEAIAEIDASLAESMKGQPQVEIERVLLRMLKEEFDDERSNAENSQISEGQAGQDTETGSTETGSGRAQQDGAEIEGQGSDTSQAGEIIDFNAVKAKAKMLGDEFESQWSEIDALYKNGIATNGDVARVKAVFENGDNQYSMLRDMFQIIKEIRNRTKVTPANDSDLLGDNTVAKPTLELTGQTNEDINAGIAAQEAEARAQQEQAKSDEAARIEAERKSRQEIASDSFDLTQTGKDAKSTKANDAKVIDNQFAGQGDLLTPAEQPKPETKPAEKVDDFGEKLEGARKDMVRAMAKEYSDDEIASLPLSKLWPLSDVNLIENKTAAALAWAAREEIPSKPRKSYALKTWVAKVKVLRDIGRLVSKALESNPELMLQKIKDANLGHFKSKVALLEAIDRDAWKRIGKVEEYPDAYGYVDGVKQTRPFVRVDIDSRTHSFSASSVADVIDKVNELLGKEKQAPRMAFEVRGAKGSYFINKTGDKNYTQLKTFDNSKDAFNFINNNYDEVLALWEATKEKFNVKETDVRNKTNRPRTGEDYRKGKDVSTEAFATTFGFRGVQFGEWVKQGGKDNDRQGALNAAYDALLDLANIINVPPKALSLEGTLGLSFGARGSGKAAAHFEPGNLVINLTKTQGAGSLAHEFFHALDNYFSRKRGGEKSMADVGTQQGYRENNYITYKPEPLYIHKNYGGKGITAGELQRMRSQNPASGYLKAENWIKDPKHPEGVRPEVEQRFADLVEALNASPMKERARAIDKVKAGTDGYWSRIIELAARSFENYVIHKMQLNGYDNDYLANVVRVESFNRDSSRFPYLLDEEIAPVAEAFDNLFSTLETKETEKGIALYSRNNQTEADYLKNLQSTWDNAKELTDEQARNDIDQLRRSAAKNSVFFTEQTLPTTLYHAVLLPRQRELDLIAKQFGKRVVGVAVNPKYAERLNRFDGATITNKNIIYLRAGAERPHLVLLGHELTHNLKSDNPALYSELLNAIKPYVKDLADFAQNYEWMSIPDISEEFISDVVADGFMSDKFWNALGEHNPSLLNRVINAVKTLISKISKKFRFNPEMKPYLTDYDKVMEIAGKAMAKYAKTDTAYSRPSAPTFYSSLAKAIPLAKQDTMPAGQWKNWLVANAGKMNVKQAELQWSGLTDWLDLQQGKVSKADIQQYLDANGVQVTETMLGDVSRINKDSKYFIPEVEKLANENQGNADDALVLALENDYDAYQALNKKFPDLMEQDDWAEQVAIDISGGLGNAVDTKYGKYTVAGGENYKELLLTLPTKIDDTPLMSEIKSKLSDPNISQIVRENLTAQLEHFSSKQKLESGFKSSHFTQRNILAHVRFDERVDADGNKTLFIQEIQSDWGQDGKKKGFVEELKQPTKAVAWKDKAGAAWEVQDKNGEFITNVTSLDVLGENSMSDGTYRAITEQEAIAYAQKRLQQNPELTYLTDKITKAPFVTETKSWVSLALKRMIRYAAENGFDKVAINLGESSNEFYDLSKQVEKIVYRKNQDNTYYISAYEKGSSKKAMLEESASADNVESILGKEIADKIIKTAIADDYKTLSGVDLRVGGEGMIAFYSQIVPQTANDVLRKLGGGKVEMMRLKGEANDPDRPISNKIARGELPVPSFTITPELRAKALEGLPLFSRPQSKFSQKSTGIDIRDLNAVVANVNQALRGLPATHVLEDYTKAPAELVADIKRDKAYDAAGAWHNGEIYLFRNNISNTNHALFTMLHESTHEGLRRVFGKEIDATLMGIYLSNQDIKQQADSLRATHKDLSLVASVEEALADMGGNGIKASVMDKLIAFVRNVLRRLGMNLKVSDGEVRALVTRALDSLKSPSKVTHYTIGSAYSAASSGDQTNTPEFKAWFGNSKVVDAEGMPMVVYHGTQSDVNVFEDKNQRQGSYFAKDRKYAELFTEQGTGTGGNVMPVYLSIKNPAKMRDGVSAKLYKELEDQGYDTSVFASYTPDDYWGLFDGDTELADALKAAGYDGVELTEPQTMGAGSESWLAFYPTQVKSAIGNNGDFNPENPDVRYSRPTPRLSPVVQPTTPNQQWQSPDKSKLDNVIYMLQNKFVDLKRVTQAIQKSGNTIEDKWNPYLLEENFTGRTAKRTKDFLKQELEPLMKSMQARKVEMADFEEYLWARHAEERNIQIAKINPAMQDGGSGMKTQDARDYLANLTAEQSANYQALAAKVDAILKTSRQRLISYGLETPETIAAWEGAYQHYVPLMREDMDNGFGNGSGQGFSVKGNASKRATGSKRAVVDVLANIAQQVERNIIRGEKNRVSTALAGLATLNPNKDFWKVDVVPKMRTVVAGKNTYEVLYNGSVVQTFTNPVEANKFIQWNGAGYTLNIAKGQDVVMDVPDPSYKNRDNIVVARIVNAKGKIEEHFVEFNTHDERAMRAAASIKNLDQDQIGELLGTASSITRYFSSINTQYNPFFGVINILRDVQGSLLNLSSTPLAGKQLDVLKNTPLALKGIYQDIRSERKTGTPTNSYWSLLFEDFQKQGGQTGYRDMYRNAKERGEALKHALDPTWWQQTTAGKIVTINGILAKPEQFLLEAGQKYIFDWLSDYNESMENAVRLSAYKVALDNGMSKAQAASLAKNISVNFNRKGEMGRQIGSLYAFFNASVQGTARIGETLFTDDNGKMTLSKAGKAIVTGGLLLGVMQALMLAAAGFGDDEPPEFVRDRNLIIPLGNGKAITIAMPLGFNALPAFGRIITEWALSGGEDTSKRFFHIFEMLAEVTNPIGNAGLSMQTITPTMFDPLAALAENKDWTGRPIAKMDFNSQKPTAGHTRAKDTASAISKGLSWAINEATGGSDYTPGALSPTPDQIDYLIGQLTGGVGREYMKLEQSATSIVTGEDLPVYKIPLVGRFYLDAEGQSSQSSRFYDNLKSVFETETELKGLRKDGLDTSEYRASHPEAALVFRANLEQREISQLYKIRSEKLKADASPDEIKALNERITARMLKFNELFKTRTTAGE